ncbi:SMI1/KNR4 family protein [Micromonospora sp. NPDC049366]|uniref:SMI1/KNR4 family protein n=1 Tax=Micromonospora sp. NPDC049366 TaxID=3364271 RepID=UPI00379F646C
MIGEGCAIDGSDTVTLWRPTGQAELDLVAASGWRAWPPRLPEQPIFYPVLNRWYATKIAREWNVPAEGVGYVTRFDVQRSYLERHEVRQAGGRDVREYWIPAEELADLNAHIVGAIVEEADYRGPVADQEFTEAEEALGRPLPDAWRRYLQGASWFRRGWMASGTYVWLNSPSEMVEVHDAWDDGTGAHPGIAVIGDNGSREQFVLDLRDESAPVLLVDISSDGWDSAIRQADTVGEFIDRVDAGTFAIDHAASGM